LLLSMRQPCKAARMWRTQASSRAGSDMPEANHQAEGAGICALGVSLPYHTFCQA